MIFLFLLVSAIALDSCIDHCIHTIHHCSHRWILGKALSILCFGQCIIPAGYLITGSLSRAWFSFICLAVGDLAASLFPVTGYASIWEFKDIFCSHYKLNPVMFRITSCNGCSVDVARDSHFLLCQWVCCLLHWSCCYSSIPYMALGVLDSLDLKPASDLWGHVHEICYLSCIIYCSFT